VMNSLISKVFVRLINPLCVAYRLRKEPTSTERRFWKAIRFKELAGRKF